MALTAETMSEIVVNREGRRARTVYLLAVLMAATIVGLLFVAHPAVAAAIKSDPVPQTDGRVSAIVVSGDTVYIGGSFTHVDGVPRSRLAAIDATDGSLLPWNPGANRHVRALVAAGSRIYAGGDFLSISGQPQHRFARLPL
jgi:PQQ-like domain